MSAFLKIGYILIVLFNFIFASWYISHGDIVFTSDIGRDFQLFREIDEKKIVLIGPRSSANVYHGPLWWYVNYPAYVMGQGNPLAVGWNWVVLWAFFTAICFFVGRALFTTSVGMLFSAWASLYFAFFVPGMNNPHGAMLLMPLFLYFFVRYMQQQRFSSLIWMFVLLGAITQFELALGIPFILLTIPPLLYLTIKHRKKKHLFAYAILVLMFANFLIFEIRHDFLILHNILAFLSPTIENEQFNYLTYAQERVTLCFTTIYFLREHIGLANGVLFLLVLGGVYYQVKRKQHRIVYLSVLYFYFGFFLLSFIDKGPILYWYIYPMVPLFFLVAASFYTTRFKNIFLLLFVIVMALNIRTAISEMQKAQQIIGNTIYSWKFLQGMSENVFHGKEQTFGYFVYAPDVLAYEPKYAMHYVSTQSDKKAQYFVKQPVTYLILQPPPPNDPEMKPDWWITNQVKITATPSAVRTFPNGYEIRRYQLTDEETKIEFDPAIDPGTHFR